MEVDGIDALQLEAWSGRPALHPSRVWTFVGSFSPRPRVIYTAQAGGERADHDAKAAGLESFARKQAPPFATAGALELNLSTNGLYELR